MVCECRVGKTGAALCCCVCVFFAAVFLVDSSVLCVLCELLGLGGSYILKKFVKEAVGMLQGTVP